MKKQEVILNIKNLIKNPHKLRVNDIILVVGCGGRLFSDYVVSSADEYSLIAKPVKENFMLDGEVELRKDTLDSLIFGDGNILMLTKSGNRIHLKSWDILN